MPIYLSSKAIALQLHQGQTHARRLHRPVRVRVRSGLVWLTVEEGGADFWLRPGREFALNGRGLAVFEAVKGGAELEIVPQPGWWARISGALARVWRGCAQPAAQSCPSCPAVGDAAPRVTQLLPRGLIRWF